MLNPVDGAFYLVVRKPDLENNLDSIDFSIFTERMEKDVTIQNIVMSPLHYHLQSGPVVLH